MITPEQRRQLLAPAVYAFLVHGGGLPDLAVSVVQAIMRSWGCDEDLIKRLALTGYPSRVANVVIANETVQRFGDLSEVEGFYQHDGCWFMDLDERWADTGFLMPVTHAQHGWISALMAFRNARDERPFRLKVRRERQEAA